MKKEPIIETLMEGSREEVITLLEAGSNPNVMTDDGWTPLIIAVSRGDADLVNLLLSKGANPDWYYNKGALEIAVKKRRIEIAVALLNAKASPDVGEPLIHAIANHDKDMVKLLISKGADVNHGTPTSTPLTEAIADPDMVKLLLQAGADPNKGWNYLLYYVHRPSCPQFHMPLHLAIDNRRLDIACMLLEKGANVNARQVYGDTPLMIAAWVNLVDIVPLLIAKGADLNAEDIDGTTALTLAVRYKHTDCVKILAQNGADWRPTLRAFYPNYEPERDFTSLRILIQYVVDVRTAMTTLVHDAQGYLLRDLLKLGADVNEALALTIKDKGEGLAKEFLVSVLMHQGADGPRAALIELSKKHPSKTILKILLGTKTRIFLYRTMYWFGFRGFKASFIKKAQ